MYDYTKFFTTKELKDADALKPSEEQTEQDKIVVSNDAYALCDTGRHILLSLEKMRKDKK